MPASTNYNIDLREHNQYAYEELCNLLRYKDRACLVQPCGTGKSLVGFEYALQNPDKSILWLSPSDYIFEQQLENLSRIVPHIKVSNIEQMTYATALSRLHRNKLDDLYYDVIIIDEFHRAGAHEWQHGIQAILNQNPHSKIIGMSATKYRYAEDNRNMARELFDNNIAHEISLVEALKQNILPKPTYVRALLDNGNKILNNYQKRIQRYNGDIETDLENELLDLRNNMQNAQCLDEIFERFILNPTAKIIVFCANEKNLAHMIKKYKEWFHLVNKDIAVYKTTCAAPNGEKDFNNFKDDSDHPGSLKILYCINQLNEGVHVGGVDAIVMVRPTWSLNIYGQQFGRSFDIASDKDPLIFDLVDNLSSAGERIFTVTEAEAHGTGDFNPKKTYDLTDLFDTHDFVQPFQGLIDKIDKKLKEVEEQDSLKQYTDDDLAKFIIDVA